LTTVLENNNPKIKLIMNIRKNNTFVLKGDECFNIGFIQKVCPKILICSSRKYHSW